MLLSQGRVDSWAKLSGCAFIPMGTIIAATQMGS
jgi:hypothetical protein